MPDLAQVAKWLWRHQTSNNRCLFYCFCDELWYINLDYCSISDVMAIRRFEPPISFSGNTNQTVPLIYLHTRWHFPGTCICWLDLLAWKEPFLSFCIQGTYFWHFTIPLVWGWKKLLTRHCMRPSFNPDRRSMGRCVSPHSWICSELITVFPHGKISVGITGIAHLKI